LAKVPKYKDWWDVKILKDQTFCQLKLPASSRGSLWKIARQGADNPETEMQVQSDHGKSNIEEEEEEEEEDWAWTRGCTRKHRRIHYDEEDEAKKKSGDALGGWALHSSDLGVECSGCGEPRSEYLKNNIPGFKAPVGWKVLDALPDEITFAGAPNMCKDTAKYLSKKQVACKNARADVVGGWERGQVHMQARRSRISTWGSFRSRCRMSGDGCCTI